MSHPRPHLGGVNTVLSAISGAPPEISAIATASILSGLAGPTGALVSESGETIARVGMNMIAVGAHDPTLNVLQGYLFDTIETYSSRLRLRSRCVDADRLNLLQRGISPKHRTDDIVRRFEEESEGGIDEPKDMEHFRTYEALRQPSITMRAPSLSGFTEGLREILDRHPFVYDPTGNLMAELSARRVGKKWKAYCEVLGAAIAGTDTTMSADATVAFGKFDQLRAGFFTSATKEQMTILLRNASASPSFRLLLQSCLIVPVLPDPGKIEYGVAQIRYGCQVFRETVVRMFRYRHHGLPTTIKIGTEVEMELRRYVGSLRPLVTDLPENVAPYLRTSLSLPFRLYWALATISCSNEAKDWILPAVSYLSRWIVEQQKGLISEALEIGEAADLDSAKQVMLKKLETGPCMFRDLVRRYACQRKEVHDPVLKSLIDENLVRLRDDGKLELTPPVRFAAVS